MYTSQIWKNLQEILNDKSKAQDSVQFAIFCERENKTISIKMLTAYTIN